MTTFLFISIELSESEYNVDALDVLLEKDDCSFVVSDTMIVLVVTSIGKVVVSSLIVVSDEVSKSRYEVDSLCKLLENSDCSFEVSSFVVIMVV